MNKIKDFLNTIEPKIVMGAVEDAQIQDAEAKLGLKFSVEYKEFLKDFGAALIAGNEFLGLATEESLNTVVQTLALRGDDTTLPRGMYIISNLHIDGLRILQNERGEIFEYVPSALPKKIFDSLKDYIQDCL